MSLSKSLHDVLDQDLETIEAFLKLDSSTVNALDADRDTPLLRILRDKKYPVDLFHLLLMYGPNVNCKDRIGSSALIIALERECNYIFIRLLLKKGANIDVRAPFGYSLICYALQNFTSLNVIKLLLDEGCLLSECHSHSTALHCAIHALHNNPMEESVLQLLIDKGSDVNAVDWNDKSVICLAVGIGSNINSIKTLLAAGAILNCSEHSYPLLCVTSLPCDPSTIYMIRFLLELGVCVNSEVLRGALHQIVNEPAIISLLLDHLEGACAKDVVDRSNNTLLQLVMDNKHVKKSVVKLLVKRGAEVNNGNLKGETVLHKVVKMYHPSIIVKTLLKSGSQVNIENNSGETALHLAMKDLATANIDILKLLIAAGARVGINGYCMLRDIVEKCDFSLGMNLSDCSTQNKKLRCFKLLMKCYFLEKPGFDILQRVFPFSPGYYELAQFEFFCARELQKLDLNIVGQNCTLREFLRGYSPFRVGAPNFGVDAKSIFDQLLRVIAKHALPLFLEIISAKVGRSTMKIKLKKLQVYTYLSDESRKGQRVVLNFDTVHKIGEFFNDDDLLRFISAFNKTDNRLYTGKISKENVHADARSDEHCHKRPRLDL